MHDAVYSDIKVRMSQKNEEGKITLKRCMTDSDYRKATWMCVFIAVANQMSGVNIINIYTQSIFDQIA